MMNAPHAILLRNAAATMKRLARHLPVALRNKKHKMRNKNEVTEWYGPSSLRRKSDKRNSVVGL